MSQEEAKKIKEQYEEALLKERFDIVKKIENLYRDTSLWAELKKIKKEIDDILIA
ncbi:MAG: hypothetical protein MUP17_06645 [candidate division Zixibacteria bacterium]|nr:hypothetical protein [candidate division Zixibacteria bacterium]